MTMSLILDAVTVLVAVLFVVIGYRRGFIKSVVRLIGFAAAVVGAALLSLPIAQFVYDSFLHTSIEAIVSGKVQEGAAAAAATLEEQIAAITASLPQGIQNLITMSGVDTSGLTGATQGADALVDTIMDSIVTPLCVSVVQLIAFLVLFLVLFLVIRLLGKVLDRVFASLPVIKQINGLLGAALGLAEGVLVLFVLCYGVQLYMSLTGAQSAITTADLEQTYIVRHLMALNPILG